MGINTTKYFYINRVGLVRNSWAHRMFEEDAQLHHMEDQPGKLVALRLTEYYEILQQLGRIPGAALVAAGREEEPQVKIAAPLRNGPLPLRVPIQEEEEESEDEEASGTVDNALLDDVDDQWDM